MTNDGNGFGTKVEDLDWIDEFASRVREYVRVRPEDNVFIKVPTEVHRLSPSGTAMLGMALDGVRAREIAKQSGATGHPDRIRAIHSFFCDVRDLLRGRVGDGRGRRAINVTEFKGSFTKYPVLAEFAITYRCNLACAFCYAGCGTPEALPRASAEELSTEDALRVVDLLADDAKVPSMSFTGGEPTLRRDLPRLIARAREKRMRVNLITNGVKCASKEFVATLVAAGLHSAQVSLEGPDAAVHDKLTNRDGSYAKTLRGLGNLREAGLTAHTHTTISRQNMSHLDGIVDLVASLGIPRLSMNMVIPTGTPGLESHADLHVSYSEIGDLVHAARQKADAAGVEFLWYSPTPFCIWNPVAHGLGNKGCAACDGLIHIAPAGDVLPCSSYPKSVGNVLAVGFDEVWFGARATFHREKRHAPETCSDCEDFALCQGACPLYWQGRGETELSEAMTKKNPHSPAEVDS